MTPDRWREVSRIYGAVLTKPERDRAADDARSAERQSDRHGRFFGARNEASQEGGGTTQIVAVQHWFDEPKRLVPVK